MKLIDSNQLEFTNKWFDINAKAIWTSLIPQLKPKKVLEIGSYEGASTCFLIKTLTDFHDKFEIHAIDSWAENQKQYSNVNISLVEERFHKNTSIEF